MSEIYFLGREDREGLALLQSGRMGVLTYDAEVGGWNRLHTDNVVVGGHGEVLLGNPSMPNVRNKEIYDAMEPALHVFASHTPEKSSTEVKEDEPWPTITYQVRFGDDQ